MLDYEHVMFIDMYAISSIGHYQFDNSIYDLVKKNDVYHTKKLLQDNPRLLNDRTYILNFSQLNSVIKSGEIFGILFDYCGMKMIDYYRNCKSSILIKALQFYDCMNAVTRIVSFDKNVVNEIDGDGFTPLCYAINKDVDIKIIEYLICNGADVNKRGELGSTPLHYSRKSNVVKLLLKCGADINATNDSSYTPLMLALNKQWDRDVILELISASTVMNVRNRSGETTLHLAFRSGYDSEIIREVFSKTHNVNTIDRFGHPPLYYASNLDWKYCKEFIFELVNKGAVITSNDFKTALYGNFNPDFVAAAIKCNIDINCLDSDSNNALYFVKHPELVRFFIKNGVSVNHKNRFGLTPLMSALKECKQVSVIKSLLDNGSYLGDCLGWHLNNSAYSLSRFDILPYDDETINELILHGADINLKNEMFLDAFKKFANERNLFSLDYFLKLSDNILKHVLVTNEYSSVIELIPNSTFSYSHVSYLFQCFLNELEKMKEINFLNNISFYDFCIKYYKSRKHHVNSSQCEYISDDFNRINSMFPNFKGAIITKIKINLKNQNRLKLLKKLCEIAISSITCCDKFSNVSNHNSCFESVLLNSDCLYNIGNYLNDWDVNSIIYAAIDGKLL